MWGRPPQESGKGVGKPAGQTELGQPQLGPSVSPLSLLPGAGGRGVWPCGGVCRERAEPPGLLGGTVRAQA